jgi:hypothetical protein
MKKETVSQNNLIRQHLESGKILTSLDALRRFGCLRLSGRIHNLRHDHGLPIKSEMVDREGKRVAEYSLLS